MRLQMRGIDHDAFGWWTFAGEGGEDAIEHVEPAPPFEAIAERLVGTIARRRVLPLQPVADDVDDPADDPSVLDARDAVRQRKIR